MSRADEVFLQVSKAIAEELGTAATGAEQLELASAFVFASANILCTMTSPELTLSALEAISESMHETIKTKVSH